MDLVASRLQLQLLAVINQYDLSLKQLQAFLQRSKRDRETRYLAALFDCLRSEFAIWDGPCLSLSPTGSSILSLALQLQQGSEDRSNCNYQFVKGDLFYVASRDREDSWQRDIARSAISVYR